MNYIDMSSLHEDDTVARVRAVVAGVSGAMVPYLHRYTVLRLAGAGDTVYCSARGLPFWRGLDARCGLVCVGAKELWEDDPKERLDTWLQWALVQKGLSRVEAVGLEREPPKTNRHSKWQVNWDAEIMASGLKSITIPKDMPELEWLGVEREKKETPYKWRLVKEEQDYTDLALAMSDWKGRIGIDVETDLDGEEPNETVDKMVGIGLSFGDECFYGQASNERFMAIMHEQLPLLPWVGHNAKYDMTVMQQHGIRTGPLAGDGMLAAYIGGEPEAALKKLVWNKYEYRMRTYKEVLGRHTRISDVDPEEVASYCCADAYFGEKVERDIVEELSEELVKLYRDTDLPLVSILVDMERTGVALDREKTYDRLDRLRGDLNRLALSLDALAIADGYKLKDTKVICPACRNGKKKRLSCRPCDQRGHWYIHDLFNPASNKQKVEWLHDLKGLPVQGLSDKTNQPSLDRLALLRLGKETNHPACELLLLWNKLDKKRSFMEDWLVRSEKDRSIHSVFTNAKVRSFRLSSVMPNVEQVELDLRDLYVAREGKIFVDADYAGLEVRTGAFKSRDKRLMEIVNRDPNTFEGNLHAQTMASIFGVPYDQQKKHPGLKTSAKVYWFMTQYGAKVDGVHRGLEKQALTYPELGIVVPTKREVQRNLTKLYREYPGYYYEYVPHAVQKARDAGGIAYTAFGRPRIIPKLFSDRKEEREAGAREVISHECQGTAGDLFRFAMAAVYKIQWGKILIPNHDELLCEVDLGREVWYAGEMVTAMELGQPLDGVPLVVDVEISDTWKGGHK